MNWLTIDMVESFHRESLVRFGGPDGLRDRGLLESALARPENVFAYEPDSDVFRLAAAYGHGLVKNHLPLLKNYLPNAASPFWRSSGIIAGIISTSA
ncbi:MAG: Fic family protein [Aestuariivirga sp.]